MGEILENKKQRKIRNDDVVGYERNDTRFRPLDRKKKITSRDW